MLLEAMADRKSSKGRLFRTTRDAMVANMCNFAPYVDKNGNA